METSTYVHTNGGVSYVRCALYVVPLYRDRSPQSISPLYSVGIVVCMC